MSKKLNISWQIILISTSLFIAGCAPTIYDVLSQKLDEGKNDEVIGELRESLTKNSGDPQIVKFMGVALYNKKYYSTALPYFERVYKMDPEDDQNIYYLAASYEAVIEYPQAIQFYRRYNEMTIFGEYREHVEARMKLLHKSQMEMDAKKALLEESMLDVDRIPLNTIAVLNFENKSGKKELDPLQKGLAEMTITDLSKVKALKVVERVRLQKLVEEMNFGETGLVDDATAPRIGKLLGASKLVKGSYFDLSNDEVRIDALIAQTRTGSLIGTTDISGKTTEFFRLQKELVFKIIEELDIKISDSEREAILTIPTENMFAFLQFSQGIDFEDKGMYNQAIVSYTAAVQADPKFSQAGSNLSSAKQTSNIISTSSSSTTSTRTSSGRGSGISTTTPPPPPSSASTKDVLNSVSDRANTSQGNASSGFTSTPGSTQGPPSVLTNPLPAPPRPPL